MSKEKKQAQSFNSSRWLPCHRAGVYEGSTCIDLINYLSDGSLGSLYRSASVGSRTSYESQPLGRYLEPGVNGYILGTDEGGKDIFGQLIIGARNSIIIGFTITIITSIVGISIGLISGYYGGRLDGFLMRIVDFIMILPVTMLIIVFVTVIKNYTIYHFILIMSAFYWTAKARLFRTRTLSEASLDYVNASKHWEQATS